ncbi:hypothetical protein RND81_05G202600 [Saponaria officinalis]|uniref:Histidine-containing phosphotransfer protein n=1 Tax=Saponaria officinalis TaxID=3572 RepID=A0AAW1L033_SAPOF
MNKDEQMMQLQYIDYRTSLFREGLLDGQFKELQKLEDGGSPGFVQEIVTLFFTESQTLLENITKLLAETV